MAKVISATDMARSFSDVIGQVYYKGVSFDIKKGANIVARLTPTQNKSTLTLGELKEFLMEGPHLDKDDIDEFETEITRVKGTKITEGEVKWD